MCRASANARYPLNQAELTCFPARGVGCSKRSRRTTAVTRLRNFQAVGVRPRECLVSFIGETRNDDLVPDGTQRPKNADFKGWTGLLAGALAPGDSATNLRSYLRSMSVETWTGQ